MADGAHKAGQVNEREGRKSQKTVRIMDSLGQIAEPKTKEELAYEALKHMILSGVLPKNVFLSQRMLARKADTNITTVRTALRQLENDGLIENVPQWGVRIPVETEERLRDLYFIREILEVGAVQKLLERRASIDLERIRQKAKRCDTLTRNLPMDIIEFSQAHFDFHMELARQSGSELLVQNLNRIHFRNWLLWHDLRVSRRRKWMNHSKLVDVIFSASEADAIAAVRQHINAGLQEELAELRKARSDAIASS